MILLFILNITVFEAIVDITIPGPRQNFREILGEFCQSRAVTPVSEALKQHFGFDSLRGQQAEAVESALAGKNSMVIMPTGGGKSLCYQLPAMLMEKPVLVISPLIALMKDQVDALRARNIAASFINSSIGKQDRDSRLKQFVAGQTKILYVTPERFRKPEFLGAIQGMDLGLLAVDEAHCVSQWGHDFRPEYGRVGEIRKSIGSPPVMALTATATAEVEVDICEKLEIQKESVFRSSVERNNLKVQIMDLYGSDNKMKTMFQLLHLDKPAIVYFSLISSMEQASNFMSEQGLVHSMYHGQLPEKIRRKTQESFIKGESSIMLATPAFGLGVDKADIRQVIHYELPGSLEAYFQEIGRGGRDGKETLCTLLYDGDDIATQMDFLKWSNPEAEFIGRVYRLIELHPEKIKADGYDYLRGELNFYNRRDFRVETAVGLLRSRDILKDWKIIGDFNIDEWDPELRLTRTRKQNEKLLELVQWVQNEEDCRLASIYKYFQGGEYERCGICDNCVRKNETES